MKKKAPIEWGKTPTPEEEYHYTLMFADTQKIIEHCDKKIEVFFKKLDKDIKKYIAAEVKKVLKRREK